MQVSSHLSTRTRRLKPENQVEQLFTYLCKVALFVLVPTVGGIAAAQLAGIAAQNIFEPADQNKDQDISTYPHTLHIVGEQSVVAALFFAPIYFWAKERVLKYEINLMNNSKYDLIKDPYVKTRIGAYTVLHILVAILLKYIVGPVDGKKSEIDHLQTFFGILIAILMVDQTIFMDKHDLKLKNESNKDTYVAIIDIEDQTEIQETTNPTHDEIEFNGNDSENKNDIYGSFRVSLDSDVSNDPNYNNETIATETASYTNLGYRILFESAFDTAFPKIIPPMNELTAEQAANRRLVKFILLSASIAGAPFFGRVAEYMLAEILDIEKSINGQNKMLAAIMAFVPINKFIGVTLVIGSGILNKNETEQGLSKWSLFIDNFITRIVLCCPLLLIAGAFIEQCLGSPFTTTEDLGLISLYSLAVTWLTTEVAENLLIGRVAPLLSIANRFNSLISPCVTEPIPITQEPLIVNNDVEEIETNDGQSSLLGQGGMYNNNNDGRSIQDSFYSTSFSSTSFSSTNSNDSKQ